MGAWATAEDENLGERAETLYLKQCLFLVDLMDGRGSGQDTKLGNHTSVQNYPAAGFWYDSMVETPKTQDVGLFLTQLSGRGQANGKGCWNSPDAAVVFCADTLNL